jgi:hypothetical protein
MVLGMHRSGTSLCSHVLSALGVDMTDRVSPGPDNRLGHWERWEIVEFHDRILRFFNREFSSQCHDFALPVVWWADPRVAEVRREIIAFLERRMGSGYFGFKDPRTIRLMPMWHQIINELRLAHKTVFCLRNPAQVARSLHRRDGFSVKMGEYRWFAYNMDFFRYTQGSEFCTIEYESWFEDPALNLAKLRNFLDLPDDRMDPAISEIVRHDLRHDDARWSEARQPLVRSVFNLARRAEHDPAAREQVQTIAAQFVTFQQLQGAFQRDIEQALAVARAEAETELAGLREALARAERQATEREAAATALQVEIAELRDAIAETKPEAEQWEASLASLRNAVGQAEQEAGDRKAAATMMQTEIAEIHEGLIYARKRAEDDESAAAALDREIAGLRDALARAELSETLARREADERVADIARLESALTGLRETVTRAQRDAEQSAAAAKSMKGELAAVQSALMAARHVGRAAINALATDKSARLDRLPQLGWRQAVRRRFALASSA